MAKSLKTEDYIDLLQGETVHIVGDLGVLYNYKNGHPVSFKEKLKHYVNFATEAPLDISYPSCAVVVALLQWGSCHVELIDYAPPMFLGVIQEQLEVFITDHNRIRTSVSYEQLEFNLWGVKGALNTEIGNRINAILQAGGLVIDGRSRDWWQYFLEIEENNGLGFMKCP